MDAQQLNILAERYQRERCNSTFNEIYRSLLPKWRRRWPRDVRETLSDEAEIESLYGFTLLHALNRWQAAKGNFEHYLNRCLKTRKIDLFRTNSHRSNKTDSLDKLTEAALKYGTPIPIRGGDKYEFEPTVIKKMIDNRRQPIIDHLLSPRGTKSDSVTIAVVTNHSRYDSDNALAKALGIHHEIVKRKLRGLARHYDANRFGDIRDYLAV